MGEPSPMQASGSEEEVPDPGCEDWGFASSREGLSDASPDLALRDGVLLTRSAILLL